MDRGYLSPPAADRQFLDWLIATCRKERVDGVLSGVEPVLKVLSENADLIRHESGAVCLVSPPEKLAVGQDKLAMCRWLESLGLNTPRYADANDVDAVNRLVEQCGFPLIAKPRSGKGSHGIADVGTREALEAVIRQNAYLIQEQVGDAREEYTTGTFSDRDGVVRGVITMRRELQYGTTYRARLGEFPEVANQATKIAAALRPAGPCNVQSRLTEGRSACFEVNLRFSGTAPLRAHFGFNDVEAAVRHYIMGEPAADLPKLTRGVCLRYWNEIYISPESVAELDENGVFDPTPSRAGQVEDFGMSKWRYWYRGTPG